jgi:hypothetical protein
MGIHRSCDETGGGGAYPLTMGRGLGCGDEGWVIGETEIVVGAEAEYRAAVDLELWALGAGDPKGPAEQAGGFELGEGLADLGLKAHCRI